MSTNTNRDAQYADHSRYSMQDEYAKKRRKRANRKRVLVASLCTFVALILVGGLAAFAFVNSIVDRFNDGITPGLNTVLVDNPAPQDPFYALLLGVDKSVDRSADDAQYGDSFRADTMILARVDPSSKQVTLVSIHRDTLVDLSEYGEQKINAAYAFGGPELAVSTVSAFAGVPISHYAEIDFDGFSSVVDTLGGVEVDVPMDIDDPDAGGAVSAGLQTLNGEQALIFCRSRHTYDAIGDGDVYRAANQRVFITALAKKVLASDPVTLASTISSLADCISTDMSIQDIVSLAQSMQGMDTSTAIWSAMAPTTSEYVNGGWYEHCNESEWKAMMQRIDAGLSPTVEDGADASATVTVSTSSIMKTVTVSNGSGIAGSAGEAAEKLDSAGYSTETGNADSFDYDDTIIVYRNADDAATAQTIASMLGVGFAEKDDGSYSFDSDFLVIIGSDWST